MTLVRDLAPDIFRQRLLVEGHYTCALDAGAVSEFLFDLARALGLRPYSDPIVYSPDSVIAQGRGEGANAGYDAFMPLVDSGIAAYFWTGPRFFSIVIYSCAAFDAAHAADFVRDALAVKGEIVRAAF